MRYLALYIAYQIIFVLILGVMAYELFSNGLDRSAKTISEMAEPTNNSKKSSKRKTNTFLLILGFFIPIINFYYLFLILTAVNCIKDHKVIKDGNTVILNKENYINNRQLLEVFEINNEYLQVSDKLVIYESYLDLFKYAFNYSLNLDDYKDIFIERNEGWYDETNNVIAVFVFNLDSYKSKDIANIKEETIKVLLHELKHKYNTENNIVFNNEDAEDEDCDNFVDKIFNKHNEIIMSIIN